MISSARRNTRRASETQPYWERSLAMIRHSVSAAILALALSGPAYAQTTAAVVQPQVAPAAMTAVATCESQMRRLAGLNKGLAANYNAQHVHEDCVARAGAAAVTDVASK
jgi:hypothetical protein